MLDQFTKYKDNPNIKIAHCSFIGDNRGYDYLTNLDVAVGDYVFVKVPDGYPKVAEVRSIKDRSQIIPNPPFKKYGWVRGVVSLESYNRYNTIDDDIGVKPHSMEAGATTAPAVEKPKEKTSEELLDDLFGKKL